MTSASHHLEGFRPPAPYREIARLAPGVWKVEKEGQFHVVRGLTSGEQWQRELLALGAVDVQGIARLQDHGVTDSGHPYLVRAWVAGEPLHKAAPGLSAQDLARALASLCDTLQGLHDHGFVHGDLKSDHVILGPDGTVTLTDFGLARPIEPGASARVSGTVFAIAPEVLMGERPGPEADVFAVGVLLQRLLAPSETSAAEFYGAFPAQSYLQALGVDPTRIPDWARGLVQELLHRDPASRPADAATVAHALRRAAGDALEVADDRAPRITIPRWLGREESWFALHQDDDEPVQVSLPPDEDPLDFARAFAMRARESARPRVLVDLERVMSEHPGEAGLAAALEGIVRSSRRADLVIAIREPNASATHALELLPNLARNGLPGGMPRARWVAFIPGEASVPHGWSQAAIPAVPDDALIAFLTERIDPDAQRSEFLQALCRLGRGSASRVEAVLDALRERRTLLPGKRLARLVPKGVVADLERHADPDARIASLEDGPLAAWAAISSWPFPATRDDLVAALGGDQDDLEPDLRVLRELGLVRITRNDTGQPVFVVRGSAAFPESRWSKAYWRSLMTGIGRRLQELGALDDLLLPYLGFLTDESMALQRVVGRAEVLRRRGNPESGLDLLRTTQAIRERCGAERSLELSVDFIRTWIALGNAVRARAELESLVASDARLSPGVHAHLLGALAEVDHDSEAAVAFYDQALASGEDAAAQDAWVAKGALLLERGQHAELEALCVSALSGKQGTPSRRTRINMHSFAALSRFRRGEVVEARSRLEQALEVVQHMEDPLGEAGIQLNLGTVLRRSVGPAASLACFARAGECSASVGHLAGEVQAAYMHAGALRETGELVESGEVLTSILRIAPHAGHAHAARVRGSIGLVLADRGHAARALVWLEDAGNELSGLELHLEAARLLARAAFLRAALDPHAPAPSEPLLLARETDPRVGLDLARRCAALGELESARSFTSDALDLARRLSLHEAESDARDLLGLLSDTGDVRSDGESDVPRVGCLARLLAQGELPELRAARDRFEAEGWDGLAARAGLALVVRSSSGDALEADRAAWARCWRRAASGLDPLAAERWKRFLLGGPDPRPSDLEAQPSDTDDDMDIRTILDINHRLVAMQDQTTLLRTILECATDLTGAERAFLILEEHGEFHVDLGVDSDGAEMRDANIEVSQTILQRVLESGEPLLLSNASEEPGLAESASVESLQLRSILCQPFEPLDGLRGVLYLDCRLRPGAFDDRARRLLSMLADQATLAVRQVRRVEEIRELNERLRDEVVDRSAELNTARKVLEAAGLPAPIPGLVGEAPAMLAVFDLIRRAAAGPLPVLVSGESGTGKELAARAIHDLGPDRDGPYVSENCTAIPASLLEAELFGARKGAFTGADRDRVGLFERAEGGTLFLDEIGELPLDFQARLLRVLETHEIRRVGDDKTRKIEFRLVSATNRDLLADVDSGRFRADLYYRLAGITVTMPALDERREDIPRLVEHLLDKESRRTGVRRRCTGPMQDALSERDWPGNVRELSNTVARLCLLSDGDLADVTLLGDSEAGDAPGRPDAVMSLAELERRAIERALERTGGDKGRAAELLGISRSKIYQKLKDYKDHTD